jgi:Asp-tRNA(Asn)/Glu-tRNA(Gln) amidotransferase A subunit family amidase
VEQALARAREMDQYLVNHGRVMGPLHGLPISLKDQFTMKGLETVMGAYDSSSLKLAKPKKIRLCWLDRKLC